MAFLNTEKTAPIALPVADWATRIFHAAKAAVSRPAKSPQEILDAQARREAARRAVDTLMR